MVGVIENEVINTDFFIAKMNIKTDLKYEEESTNTKSLL